MLKLAERVRQAESCREDAGLTVDELWLRCFALGGVNGPLELEAFLFGALRPNCYEYNLMAVALNEYFMDAGCRHSIAYIENRPDK